MDKFWFIVRVVIIAVGAGGEFVRPLAAPEQLQSEWVMALVGFLFFPVAVVVGLAVLFLLRGPRLSFNQPSWFKNPFDFSHPEQFLHLAGYAFLAQGSAMIIHAGMLGVPAGAFHITVVGLGAGILLGLYIMGVAYRVQINKSC